MEQIDGRSKSLIGRQVIGTLWIFSALIMIISMPMTIYRVSIYIKDPLSDVALVCCGISLIFAIIGLIVAIAFTILSIVSFAKKKDMRMLCITTVIIMVILLGLINLLYFIFYFIGVPWSQAFLSIGTEYLFYILLIEFGLMIACIACNVLFPKNYGAANNSYNRDMGYNRNVGYTPDNGYEQNAEYDRNNGYEQNGGVNYKKNEEADPNREVYTSMVRHVVGYFFLGIIWHLIWVHKITKYLNKTSNFNIAPKSAVLLSLLVPLYSIYWMYEASEAISKLTGKNNVTLYTVLGVVMPVIPAILIQSDLNKLRDSQPNNHTDKF